MTHVKKEQVMRTKISGKWKELSVKKGLSGITSVTGYEWRLL